MTEAEVRKFYSDNTDFKKYVDKYCASGRYGAGIPLAEAMRHEIVRRVAEMYRDAAKGMGDCAKSTHTPMGECR